jgi:putative addiction module component (TIGR02574 family)
MGAPLLDFSHLSAEQRIELAEQLWDSLDANAVGPSEQDVAELRRRRASLASDGEPGTPWRDTIESLRQRGG